jgi:hypothetical protein
MEWILLSQVRNWWQPVLNVMETHVAENVGKYFTG